MIDAVEVRVKCDRCGADEFVEIDGLPDEWKVRKVMKDKYGWGFGTNAYSPEFICPDCQPSANE